MRRVALLLLLLVTLGCPGAHRGTNDVRTLATAIPFGSSLTEVMEQGGPPDNRYFNPGGVEETWEYWDKTGNGDMLKLTIRDNRVADVSITTAETP